MDILTFGDFYRVKYGKWMELAASVCLVLSYIGWIAAQMVALGMIMHLVVPAISTEQGIWICSLIVVLYTFTGGMWSVAITDFVQSMLIIIGILLTFYELQTEIPLGKVISQTPDSYFRFLPNTNLTDMLNYAAAWITIGLGSIPQQDVFQRIMASKSERVAVRSSYIGGFMYLTVAMVPLILVLYTRIMAPQFLQGEEAQLMLPNLIRLKTSMGIQIIFFGALLSAVMSTASGALLAPSAILGENIIGHYLVKDKKRRLFYSRFSVLIIAAIALSMALSNGHIYELVGESSALSLVSLFVPMVAGIYWKKANPAGAILSLVLGMVAWLLASHFETEINPLLYGFAASIVGMVLGVLLPQRAAAMPA
jgi:Na+/proline symporter